MSEKLGTSSIDRLTRGSNKESDAINARLEDGRLEAGGHQEIITHDSERGRTEYHATEGESIVFKLEDVPRELLKKNKNVALDVYRSYEDGEAGVGSSVGILSSLNLKKTAENFYDIYEREKGLPDDEKTFLVRPPTLEELQADGARALVFDGEAKRYHVLHESPRPLEGDNSRGGVVINGANYVIFDDALYVSPANEGEVLHVSPNARMGEEEEVALDESVAEELRDHSESEPMEGLDTPDDPMSDKGDRTEAILPDKSSEDTSSSAEVSKVSYESSTGDDSEMVEASSDDSVSSLAEERADAEPIAGVEGDSDVEVPVSMPEEVKKELQRGDELSQVNTIVDIAHRITTGEDRAGILSSDDLSAATWMAGKFDSSESVLDITRSTMRYLGKSESEVDDVIKRAKEKYVLTEIRLRKSE